MINAGGNRSRSLTKTIDWPLVICYLVLVFIGWANIYASVHSAEPASIFDFDSRSGKKNACAASGIWSSFSYKSRISSTRSRN